jgi:hypothetical protein
MPCGSGWKHRVSAEIGALNTAACVTVNLLTMPRAGDGVHADGHSRIEPVHQRGWAELLRNPGEMAGVGEQDRHRLFTTGEAAV